MNLSQLYYFKKLAETEHYTNAAKELYVTQPALSKAISLLEEELGVALFQKRGRNVQLTKYGKNFYKYVNIALRELDNGIEQIQAISGILDGVIDIGCIPTLIGNFLPMIIKEYLKETNAKTQFNIFNGMTLDIIEGLKSEKYDLGFCSYVDNEPDLEFIPILSQEFVILVNNQHSLAKEPFVALSDLRDYPIITYRENLPIGKVIMKYLEAHNLSVTYDFDDEISIAGMLFSNDKIAVVASTCFLLQFNHLKQIKTDIPQNARLIYMVSGKKNYHVRPVKMFSDYLIKREDIGINEFTN